MTEKQFYMICGFIEKNAETIKENHFFAQKITGTPFTFTCTTDYDPEVVTTLRLYRDLTGCPVAEANSVHSVRDAVGILHDDLMDKRSTSYGSELCRGTWHTMSCQF